MTTPLLEAKGLSAYTHDGHSLFDDIDLCLDHSVTGLVGRNGCGKSTLLKQLTGQLAPEQGQIKRHGHIGYLPQSFQPASGDTVADLLGCRDKLIALQRISEGSSELRDFEIVNDDWDLEVRLNLWLEHFSLGHLTLQQTATKCSGGELTRLRLIATLLPQPDLLLLDEPSNHLDADGRQALIKLITAWKGGVLLVSHDRQLLDTTQHIVELSSLGLRHYPGPWQHYEQVKQEEEHSAEQRVEKAHHQLQRQQRQQREVMEKKQRSESRGKKQRHNANQAKFLLDKAKERSEATKGRLSREQQQRLEQAQQELATASAELEQIKPIHLRLSEVTLPSQSRMVALNNVTLILGGRKILDEITLEITGPQRLAITGHNGCGKSTLLRVISGELTPDDGERYCHPDHVLLDQQLTLLNPQESALDNFRRINPGLSEADYRTRLAALRLRKEKTLQAVSTLSGGEQLKVALTCLLLGPQPPKLLMLDEPTNHQDLESIAVLEQALRDYRGALIVVSHDRYFLERINITHELELEKSRQKISRFKTQ